MRPTNSPTSQPSGPRAPIRVLLLEDNPADALLIHAALERQGLVAEITRVASRAGYALALRITRPDVILCECVVPGLNAIAALGLARRYHPGLPVIVVTGLLADDAIVRLLRFGAADYVLKDRMARLGAAIRRAVSAPAPVRAPLPMMRRLASPAMAFA